MIEFICVGRLAEEKGIGTILSVLERLLPEYSGQFRIHFFGDGPLRKRLERLTKKFDEVVYYGHQPKQRVFEQWEHCKYTLMPSLFLETFGLSALDSLSLGIPVVGYGKGGLTQFLKEETLLIDYGNQQENTQGLYLKIKCLIDDFDENNWKKQSLAVKKIYEKYTWELRLKRFQKESGLLPGAKVALVSDYGKDIGGLENRLFLLVEKLQAEGYSVELFGGINKKPSRLKMLIALLGTIANVPVAIRLKKQLQVFSPDLVRYHSVHRVLGRLPLWVNRNIGSQQRIMYHDFGLFHPYPSSVYRESQIDRAVGFVGYMQESVAISWKGVLLQAAKFFQRKIMFFFINRVIHKHYVPSQYLVKKVRPFISKKGNVSALPHFIQPKQTSGEQSN